MKHSQIPQSKLKSTVFYKKRFIHTLHFKHMKPMCNLYAILLDDGLKIHSNETFIGMIITDYVCTFVTKDET